MSEKLEKLVEALDELTLLEAAELSKLLQDKWGVSAAAPMAMAGMISWSVPWVKIGSTWCMAISPPSAAA